MGAGPAAGLTPDGKGNLFGTTFRGGLISGGCGAGCGTVFQTDPVRLIDHRVERVGGGSLRVGEEPVFVDWLTAALGQTENYGKVNFNKLFLTINDIGLKLKTPRRFGDNGGNSEFVH